MKYGIFLRKIASMTSVLCLTPSNFPQLNKCMNRRNEHFLHLSKFWQIRSPISWIHTYCLKVEILNLSYNAHIHHPSTHIPIAGVHQIGEQSVFFCSVF